QSNVDHLGLSTAVQSNTPIDIMLVVNKLDHINLTDIFIRDLIHEIESYNIDANYGLTIFGESISTPVNLYNDGELTSHTAFFLTNLWSNWVGHSNYYPKGYDGIIRAAEEAKWTPGSHRVIFLVSRFDFYVGEQTVNDAIDACKSQGI